MECDVADFVDGDDFNFRRSGFWLRIAIKVAIVYAMFGFFYWEEIRFQTAGMRLEGRVVEMYAVGDRQAGLLIKYDFHDPLTGTRRHDAAEIGEALRPTTDVVAVEYIPGEFPRSRLAMESRPGVKWVFLGMTATFGTTVLMLLGYLAWEANHKPLTRQQRAVAAYRREKRIRARA